jgi:hypothetical protein
MDREGFENLILTNKNIFARYARLFMDDGGTPFQGFMDWCWEKYQHEVQPIPHFFPKREFQKYLDFARPASRGAE